jgi:two-component system sensor histidine kinase CreC
VIRLLVVAASAIGLILLVAFVIARVLRTRTRGMSIRLQVFLALATIVGAFAFGLGLMVIDRVEARAVRVASFAAREQAEMIAAIAEDELTRGAAIEKLASRLSSAGSERHELGLELLGPDGEPLFSSGAGATLGAPGTVSYDAKVVLSGRTVGMVRVIKPTLEIRRMLADLAPTVLVISLVLGVAAGLAAVWIGRAIARPIEALSEFGERVSRGERTEAPVPAQGREVRRLASAIDSMRRQLEGRPFVETFAADLSHELKNPVAAILASAEVLEEGAINEPEEGTRFVRRIREAAGRIERLLRDLVSLARIEARGVESFDPVNLAEVASSVVWSLGDRGARLQVGVEGDARVRGDEAWLSRATFNLIDNALVHGEPNSVVEVVVARLGQDVTVEVKNRGAVSKHVHSQLFQRFVTTRPDKGGSGLGLASGRAVAEAHGGHLELAAPGPPIVAFRLILPAYRPGSLVG